VTRPTLLRREALNVLSAGLAGDPPVASRRRILAAAGIAAALVAVGLVVWLALPAREPAHSPASSTTSTATTDPDPAAKLADVLPPGYPAVAPRPASTRI
jgi:hypothetical protein